MQLQLLLPLVLTAVVLGYSFWMRRRASSALTGAKPAYVSFFARTGYRYADMPDAPPEAQAERSLSEAKSPRADGKYSVEYVRDYHGLRVRYSSASGHRTEGGERVYWSSNRWEAQPASPPRLTLHIADKSLDSALKTAKDLFSQRPREFEPQGSERVQTGIAEIDSKLVVWSDQPSEARALLRRNAALTQLLGGWAELDISLTPSGARFEDPEYRNMMAAMGGMIGSMALGFDYGKRLELAIPVHDRVADLFLALTRASAG